MKYAHLILGMLCIVILAHQGQAQSRIQVLDSNTFVLSEGVVLSKTSFRGLSVVDDNNIWVSGSRGTFARSINGGKTFIYQQLKGYEKSDFRDIEAFDDKCAIMMSSGTPALILKTTDGGINWKEVFRQNDSAYFLDAMDFWDEKRGMLVGDPINGHFVLLETKDGGETWREFDSTKTPKAIDGEAVFAASGTSLRCWGKNKYGFVTGGMASRLFCYDEKKKDWDEKNLGLGRGNSSSGAFSFYVELKNGAYYIVGGDYLNDTSNVNTNQVVYDFDDPTITFYNGIHGYISSIEVVNDKLEVTCGTNGVGLLDVRTNDRWQLISNEPFHVVRKAKKGKAVFLAGPKGKIGKLVY